MTTPDFALLGAAVRRAAADVRHAAAVAAAGRTDAEIAEVVDVADVWAHREAVLAAQQTEANYPMAAKGRAYQRDLTTLAQAALTSSDDVPALLNMIADLRQELAAASDRRHPTSAAAPICPSSANRGGSRTMTIGNARDLDKTVADLREWLQAERAANASLRATNDSLRNSLQLERTENSKLCGTIYHLVSHADCGCDLDDEGHCDETLCFFGGAPSCAHEDESATQGRRAAH